MGFFMPQPPAAGSRPNLVQTLSAALARDITSGAIHLGGCKLSSEAALTTEHGISRTVIHEAIATLRADGLVEARQGAGAFNPAPYARNWTGGQAMTPQYCSPRAAPAILPAIFSLAPSEIPEIAHVAKIAANGTPIVAGCDCGTP